MWHDEKYKSGITAENLSSGLSSNEMEEMERELNSYDIGLAFVETRAIRASAFESLFIFINEHLTELIITGLLAPTAYDIIKSTVLLITRKSKGFIMKSNRNEPKECSKSLRLRVGEAEIIAPIPGGLSDDQFSKYMDMLRDSLAPFATTQAPKIERYEIFLAEYSDECSSIHIKTIIEYGNERIAEQRKKEKE